MFHVNLEECRKLGEESRRKKPDLERAKKIAQRKRDPDEHIPGTAHQRQPTSSGRIPGVMSGRAQHGRYQ